MEKLSKNIWILWLQGWNNAPWLQQQVLLSWQINNPGWTINKLSMDNLKDYVTDIEYIYDIGKHITLQHKSDIIRLSVLKNHGGVWADSTLLCMQPLDPWIYTAIAPTGFWIYRGPGGDMPADQGPASWFIVSVKESYMITQWKKLCDTYWEKRTYGHKYFFLDYLFRELVTSDNSFKKLWYLTPSICCEDPGQSHMLAYRDGMISNDSHIKNILLTKPPYVLKLWDKWNSIFPDTLTDQCQQSNGFYAISLSIRKITYIHPFS